MYLYILKEPLRILALLAGLLLGGVFCIVLGIGTLSTAATLSERQAHAAGTVLSTRERPSGTEQAHLVTEYEVEFTASDGDRHVFWTTDADTGRGGTVDVLYDPSNPDTAIIGSPEDKLFEGIYFLAAGVAALAGFAIAVWSLRKKPRGRRRR